MLKLTWRVVGSTEMRPLEPSIAVLPFSSAWMTLSRLVVGGPVAPRACSLHYDDGGVMWRLVDFSPFIALGLAERYGLVVADRFYIAAALAAAAAIASVIFRRRVNPLITGAFLWFFFMALAFILWIKPVGLVLQHLGESSLFVFTLIAGAYETVTNPRGYVDAVSGDRAAVRRLSLAMIAANVAAFGLSYALRGDVTLSGVLPYALLFLVQAWLRRKLPAPAVDHVPS